MAKRFCLGLSATEVVVFTAGLEDYAQPIINELHRRYNCFPKELRLYRPATTPCAIYSCVKVQFPSHQLFRLSKPVSHVGL